MNGNRIYGIMSDDLKISFLSPTLSARLFNHNKNNALIMNISLGFMGYSDEKLIIDRYKITGSTTGMIYDAEYDIGLSGNFLLGSKVSLVSGVLSQYKWSDGIKTETIKLEEDEYEGLGRIDLSLVLKFSK